jgi:phytoene dehydrogenase-like protein
MSGKGKIRSANVIGSGPNGLAAAITLAQAGVAVTVYERNERVGGACSTAEVTLPGFRHDLGSSVYPLGVASPFFRSLPLERYGLEWVEPDTPLAHPMDEGPALMMEHSLADTAAQFEAHDARAWRALMAPTVRDWPKLVEDVTRSLLRFPRHPLALASFGAAAVLPARTLALTVFKTERARALFAGCAAHAVIPLTKVASSATGLVLMAAAHSTGWPLVRGGAQSLSDALAADLGSLGGAVVTGFAVSSLAQLPPSDVAIFDTSAQAMGAIAGDALTSAFRTRLEHAKAGPGIFKVDYALREPIPWKDPACRRAGTVHLGGTLAEIERSEHAAFYGQLSERPFVLLVQPSLFDPSRVPQGRDITGLQTAWAYCHVPHGSEVDRTDVIEGQIERFAPGFRDVVLARRAWNTSALGEWNPNLAGGDISGGVMTLSGLIARPTLRTYRTGNPAVYLASASTPPGGGVHGMCGYGAALAALSDHRAQT